MVNGWDLNSSKTGFGLWLPHWLVKWCTACLSTLLKVSFLICNIRAVILTPSLWVSLSIENSPWKHFTDSKHIYIVFVIGHPCFSLTIKIQHWNGRDCSHSFDFSWRTASPQGILKACSCLFFFFFLMTLTFWKTSPANRLVLSCLMWLEFLLGHLTPNSLLDAHIKNTNKRVWVFFFLSFSN